MKFGAVPLKPLRRALPLVRERLIESRRFEDVVASAIVDRPKAAWPAIAIVAGIVVGIVVLLILLGAVVR